MASYQLHQGSIEEQAGMSEVKQITVGVPAEKRSYPLTLSILGIVFLLTTGWFINALASAPSVELWGFLVANYIFLLGVSQFGQTAAL